MENADVPVMPMHTLETVLVGPHLNAVGFFKNIEHPIEGRIRQMQVPSTWSITQPRAGGPAPMLGEHGHDVLREAGFRPTKSGDKGAVIIPLPRGGRATPKR